MDASQTKNEFTGLGLRADQNFARVRNRRMHDAKTLAAVIFSPTIIFS